jgi:hypothetical protein
MIPHVRYVRAAAAAALLFLTASCSSISGPVTTDAYLLDRLNGSPLPAMLDRSAHRSIEVLAGTLQLRSDGRARMTSRVRVTDAGADPVEAQETVEGTWRRSGGNVVITLADGWVHTVEELAGGERLRTAAMRCTWDCGRATAVLHVFEFQRAVVVGQGGGS